METINEFIPFAKEMLSQRPNRRMVKMYVLGSTMAMLGMVGGLVETVLLPFVDREPVEDQVLDLYIERSVEVKKEVKRKRSVVFRPEVTDVEETETEMESIESFEEAKAKHLVKAGRRMSSNRLHAS